MKARLFSLVSLGLAMFLFIPLLIGRQIVQAQGPEPSRQTVRPDMALIILRTDNTESLLVAKQNIEQLGVRVRHVFTPNVLFAQVPPNLEVLVRHHHSVASLNYGPVEMARYQGALLTTQQAVAVWNAYLAKSFGQPVPPPRDFRDQELQPPDAFRVPPARSARSRATDSQPSHYYQTSEYMVGDIAVGFILPASNGIAEPSLVQWTAAQVQDAQAALVSAMDYFIDLEPNAHLTFFYQFESTPPLGEVAGTVSCDYEAATHGLIDEQVDNSCLRTLGYTDSSVMKNRYDYVNDLRSRFHANWAFIAEAVNPGRFGKCADSAGGRAFLSGPELATCGYYWGVIAHETYHIFGAEDQYWSNSPTSLSGYLQVVNANSFGDNHTGYFQGSGENQGCPWVVPYFCGDIYSKGQIGWRDSDGDGILDVMDTFPNTSFDSKTGGDALTYTGTAVDMPLPSEWHDKVGISVNTIANVQYRIDGRAWLDAVPVDARYDATIERFTFTTPRLPNGLHAIEARAINSVGNIEVSYAVDKVLVTNSPVTNTVPFATFVVTPTIGNVRTMFTMDASSSSDLEDPPGDLKVRWDWNGDGVWDTPFSTVKTAAHQYSDTGTKEIRLQVKDTGGNTDVATRSIEATAFNVPPHAFFRVSPENTKY